MKWVDRFPSIWTWISPLTPPPLRNFLGLWPPHPPGMSNSLRGGGMDIFWNYTFGWNSEFHSVYQFTFEPLHLCFRRWLWFRIWTKILSDRRIWQKRHRSADWHTPIHPPPGDDQHFQYDDDSDNGSDGFVVEEDGAIRAMQSEELGFLLASRRTRSERKVTTTRKVLLWT